MQKHSGRGVFCCLMTAALPVVLYMASDPHTDPNRRLLRMQQLIQFPLQVRLIDHVSLHQPAGYELTTIPLEIQQVLAALVDDALGAGHVGAPFHHHVVDGRATALPLPRNLAALLRALMQPKLEEFCGCALQNGIVHGIRVYHPGALLLPHADWPHAWVVSATLNVRRNALMYEASRLLHSRPEPLRGGVYAAVFIGFTPVGYPNIPSAGIATRAIVTSVMGMQQLGLRLGLL
ncbi:hypothetical protein EMIHUDRAFT_202788 [Emiliania huxleyi CCMP1516]|uniref:Prolyl 4-hydroxylase alpha subunit domain-containing protein n=2 Tax=Emiliania huxleyi TaxID=2903 RepID=A0A0D3K8T3_EMIH1|nr:hypothetical protein EMIHUDRAFT_202788 [Emiliania huxleyi CCMP1516]EOD32168.1 hypothetical protein EMIHUDRAFT_202788 [Emiliania huxleyi CCMP1516]|eukprot:XP_005784597.1 hypothetical protein EMIHUDRAFT_202788 [Emiliania huxleyi CCMP1516]